MSKKQPFVSTFFDDEEVAPVAPVEPAWKEEWVNMPEFVQEQQKPYSQIICRFNNEEDLQEFAKMIGQKLTNKTKSIWHPQLVRGIHSKKRYVDET
jgi:hypothetical protein